MTQKTVGVGWSECAEFLTHLHRRCATSLALRPDVSCELVVLTIGKLRAGQEHYFEREVARGVEDYYAGRGELPGVWHGRVALDLGLLGEADAAALGAVFTGVPAGLGASVPGPSASGLSVAGSPGLGSPGPGLADARPTRRRAGEVAAWDLTFSAPKSVSLLWAFGGNDVAAAVVDAHSRAVAAGLGYLQEAVASRTGHAGGSRVAVDGFWGIAYRHRSNRDGDPQLHSHVVIANRTRCDDGVWRALDGRDIYALPGSGSRRLVGKRGGSSAMLTWCPTRPPW